MFSWRDLEWSSSQKVAMEEVSRMGVDDDDGGGVARGGKSKEVQLKSLSRSYNSNRHVANKIKNKKNTQCSLCVVLGLFFPFLFNLLTP